MPRILMKILSLACAVALWAPAVMRADAPTTVNADEALKLLQAGNQRYVDGKLNSVTPEELARRRAELALIPIARIGLTLLPFSPGFLACFAGT
ncbi:MAG: hypothetical protein WCQ21_38215, partial [Verrucomicrobiota bacterium]